MLQVFFFRNDYFVSVPHYLQRKSVSQKVRNSPWLSIDS